MALPSCVISTLVMALLCVPLTKLVVRVPSAPKLVSRLPSVL